MADLQLAYNISRRHMLLLVWFCFLFFFFAKRDVVGFGKSCLTDLCPVEYYPRHRWRQRTCLTLDIPAAFATKGTES